MIEVQRIRLEVARGVYATDPKNIVVEGVIRRDKSYNLNPNAEDLVIMDLDEYREMIQTIDECKKRIPLMKALDNSDFYLTYDLDNNRPVCQLCIPTEFETIGTPKFTIIFNDRTIEYTADKKVRNVSE